MERRFTAGEGGLRLDRFLALELPELSRQHLKDLIRRGWVEVDGSVRPPDHRLQGGETVTVRSRECAWAGLPLAGWILYEDEHLLVLDKPAGLVMHPAGDSWARDPEAALTEPEANLAGLLRLRLGPVEGLERCGIVHRLDRETSGVLVAAKSREAQRRLTAAFAERRVEKVYRAVVLGRLESAEVSAPLKSGGGRRRARVSPFGREARTALRAVGSGRGVTLAEARPVTGRTHQIRAHLAFFGHPVLGDPEAVGDWPERLKGLGLPTPPRMMLHAWRLAFDHPLTGKPVRFTAPLPKDFRDYWKTVSR